MDKHFDKALYQLVNLAGYKFETAQDTDYGKIYKVIIKAAKFRRYYRDQIVPRSHVEDFLDSIDECFELPRT